ncbi:MAG: hypothetical protein ACYDBJ_18365 [Aggregatilineales bacterium]
MSRTEDEEKPDVQKREREIIKFLRKQREGATASDIYKTVTEELGDTISRPAYYKILDRLVAVGKIDQIEDQGIRRYIIALKIHSANRLTLDDVYERLPEVESTIEAIGQVIEAQEYFLEHRHTVLRHTAQALTQESAVDLFYLWISDLLTMLEKDLESYFAEEEEGPHIGERVLADGGLDARIVSQCNTLREILYRYLSIPFEAVDLPEWEGVKGLRKIYGLKKKKGETLYEREALRKALQKRVFGIGEAGTFLGLVTIVPEAKDEAAQDMIISGSDGSFHAGTLGLRSAQGFIEDESFIITFNNSVAYIRSSARLKQQTKKNRLLYSVPISRNAINDPDHQGMVLIPFMFPMLTESEYEHMTRTATDVVQMRVDEALITGKARDLDAREPIVPPRVHFRDGTITPQERGFNHYILRNPYGAFAREGINLSRNILQRITASSNPPIYAGAVKSTQIRLFSRLVNWYIGRGSQLIHGQAIEANWDTSRAGYISDIDVMTILLSSPELAPSRDRFWMSCVVIRQFASLTDFYSEKLGTQTWFDFLNRKRERALEDYEQYQGELPYHALLSEDALADDAYLYMLDHADYATFYVGHTGGEPPPKIPRYEFLCSLRSLDNAEEMRSHVHKTLLEIGKALITCGFEQDRDHNFLSHLSLVKLIPSVVYRAHEAAKELGQKLDSEFKSIVIQWLSERRRQKILEGDVEIKPVGIRAYLERFASARRALPSPKQDKEER